MSNPTRVIVVVDWRRQRVRGVTCDDAEAQRWTRESIAMHDGDASSATWTVGLVDSHRPPAEDQS